MLSNQHVLLKHCDNHKYNVWGDVLRKEDRSNLEKVRNFIWNAWADKISQAQKNRYLENKNEETFFFINEIFTSEENK